MTTPGITNRLAASNDEIKWALVKAEMPALLPCLAFLTGDKSLLRDGLRPNLLRLREPFNGYSEDQQNEIRMLALGAIVRLRDEPSREHSDISDVWMHRLMEHVVGEHVPAGYIDMLKEELSLTNEDLRKPSWRASKVSPQRDFRVAIIGAGMSGILAAHRLRQVGIDIIVYEKNTDVGGTWLENQYPGCRVDNPNHMYSYSFKQRHDWPFFFSPQPVLLEYFRRCSDEFGVRDAIRFSTRVESLSFDDHDQMWSVTTVGPSGRELTRVNAVISAVGQLNRPMLPTIPGSDTFRGPSFHSAQWRHDVDLTDKRVAVIGTGASAIQFIPDIAPVTKHLDVFQRTPNWFLPAPQYHEKVSDELQWLLANIPAYAQWFRFWLFWRLSENVLPACKVSDNWDGDEARVSPLNDELRALLTMYLEFQFADRPDMLNKVIPKYPPAAKRIVIDNGAWATALKRPNVSLTTDSIASICPEGIVTSDDRLHEAEAIIYATGFEASRFLMPMKVTGANGVDLHEWWDGNASAYLGITMPHFPNLFCLYGPNTNIVVNGSIIYFSECEVHYVTECLRVLLEKNRKTMTCREDVYQRYSERINDGNSKMVWGASQVNSWYKNSSGRVTQNWPFSLLDYWQQTRTVTEEDYTFS